MNHPEVKLIVIRPFAYDSEKHTVRGSKGIIVVENLTPQLTDEERIEQFKCIEEGLFEIFVKYSGTQKNSFLRAAAV